jgi:hypothetical protein
MAHVTYGQCRDVIRTVGRARRTSLLPGVIPTGPTGVNFCLFIHLFNHVFPDVITDQWTFARVVFRDMEFPPEP